MKKKAIQRGEVYFAVLGTPFGSEQGGQRPVVILQNDQGNRHSNTVIVALLTSNTGKASLPTHYILRSTEGLHLKQDTLVMLEQLKTIDKRRLVNLTGSISEEDLRGIERALRISVGLAPPNSDN